MAQVWRFPGTPLADAAGTAMTAASLSGSGVAKLPRIPAAMLVRGGRLAVRATLEASCTTTGSTAVVGVYAGAPNSAIGSKIAIAVTGALGFATGAAAWPAILTYDGTLRDLSATAGVIHGQGTYKSGHVAGGGGLAVALTEFPFPITQALRTVSTLVTTTDLEIDIGCTMSATTGAPSLTVTDLWAELSG